jgi:hypothetical protein
MCPSKETDTLALSAPAEPAELSITASATTSTAASLGTVLDKLIGSPVIRVLLRSGWISLF